MTQSIMAHVMILLILSYNKMTHSEMALRTMKLNITILGIKTLSIMTLSIMTVNIMTPSITQHNDTQHNVTQHNRKGGTFVKVSRVWSKPRIFEFILVYFLSLTAELQWLLHSA